MPTKPERKIALVTGALTGIGRAAAIAFAQEGAKVVVPGRREKEGQELAAELQKLGAEAILFVLTSAMTRTCVSSWIKRSAVSDASILQSITLERKGHPAR